MLDSFSAAASSPGSLSDAQYHISIDINGYRYPLISMDIQWISMDSCFALCVIALWACMDLCVMRYGPVRTPVLCVMGLSQRGS
eukprot:1647018-Prymnesium_polylepis.3